MTKPKYDPPRGSGNWWAKLSPEEKAKVLAARSASAQASRRALPPELAEEAGRRFRMLRLQRGITQNGFQALSGGAIGDLEREDFSAIKIGSLYQLGVELGEPVFLEFLKYLFDGAEERIKLSQETRLLQRAFLYLRALEPANQQILVDMLEVWVNGLVAQGQIVAPRNPEGGRPRRATVMRRTAGQALHHAERYDAAQEE